MGIFTGFDFAGRFVTFTSTVSTSINPPPGLFLFLWRTKRVSIYSLYDSSRSFELP